MFYSKVFLPTGNLPKGNWLGVGPANRAFSKSKEVDQAARAWLFYLQNFSTVSHNTGKHDTIHIAGIIHSVTTRIPGRDKYMIESKKGEGVKKEVIIR